MKSILAISLLDLLVLTTARQICNTRGVEPCKFGVCTEQHPGDFARDVGGICTYVSCTGTANDACPSGSSCYFLGGAASHGTCVTNGAEISYGITKQVTKRNPLPEPKKVSPSTSSSTGAICAGLTGIQCPAGQICKDPGPADEPGTCVASTCGGFTNAICPTGFKCKRTGGNAGICVAKKSKSTTPPTPSPLPATNVFCGGFANIQCASSTQLCIDNPNDNCDPSAGGADCGGICVTKTTESCGGFAGKSCSTGTCIDDPSDDCDLNNGGTDCAGVCVRDYPVRQSQVCGTKGAAACPFGQSCFVDPASGCFGAKDCPGFCAEVGIF